MPPTHPLTVYEPPFRKIRIGRANDGGYVIVNMPGKPPYDLFLTGGLGKEVTFEKAFCQLYPTVKGYAFDTVCEQALHPNLTHIPKFIGKSNTDKTVMITDYFGTASNIFMKMDIEGGEVALFETLTKEHLKRISQLVLEIHSYKEVNIPTRLAETHWLVHLHPNNNRPLVKVGDLIVPDLYEATYIRKDKFLCLTNSKPIPDPTLDQKNVPSKPAVSLSGPPFVFEL
jgi:hypothetical protein